MPEGFEVARGYVEVVANIERDSVKRAAGEAGDLAGDTMGDHLVRGVDSRLRDERDRFASGGERAGKDMGRGMGEGAGRTFGNVLAGHLPTIFSNPYVLGAAGVAGALLAPALGAGIAGGLLGAGGLGLIAGGLALVANRPEIKSAAQRLKDRFLDIDTTATEEAVLAAQERLAAARKSKNKTAVKDAKADLRTLQKDLEKAQAFNEKNFSLRDAAGPLIQPAIQAMGIFEKAAGRIIPKLAKMFATMDSSGAITSLATGLVSLTENALPGMLKLIEASGPFLASLGPGLAKIGEGIGFFAEQIAIAGPDAQIFFSDLMTWTAGFIAGLGLLIRFLSQAYTGLRTFFTSIPGWVSSAGQWFVNLWNGITARGTAVLTWFQLLPGRIGAAIGSLPGKVRSIFGRLFDLVTTGIGMFIGHAVRLWLTLPTKIAGALITLPGRVLSVLGSMRSRALGAIAQFIGSFVSTMRTLVPRALAAIGNLGSAILSRLRGAVGPARSIGADIIRGIISGIGSMVGAAASAAARAARNIVGAAAAAVGAHSPSRLMADRVGRWLLPGMIMGMESTIPAARHAMASAVGSVVPQVSPGAGTAGTGALSGSGGGVTYYFAPGSIVLDASRIQDITALMQLITHLATTARAAHARTATVGGVR
jgi:hypothetical protein